MATPRPYGHWNLTDPPGAVPSDEHLVAVVRRFALEAA